MDRTSAAGNVARMFSNGNPVTAQPATDVDAAFLNGVQEEMAGGLIEAAGLVPNAAANDQVRKAIMLLVWPVGSIHINSNLAFNPSTAFGGTWLNISIGRVPVGYDASQTEFNAVGKQGGEKKHLLTTEEIPAHHHDIPFYANGSGTGGTGRFVETGSGSISTTDVGGGTPHNNLQPYEVVGNVWKRTA